MAALLCCAYYLQIIRKEEVDLPLEEEVDLEDSQDYPPKIKLRFSPQTEHPMPSECNVQVVGLEQEYIFTIPLIPNKVMKDSTEGSWLLVVCVYTYNIVHAMLLQLSAKRTIFVCY